MGFSRIKTPLILLLLKKWRGGSVVGIWPESETQKVIHVILMPLKKQDAQVVDLQGGAPFLFLVSLPPAGRGWFANKSLQATRDDRSSSGWLPKPATRWMPQVSCSLRESWSRFTLIGPACLSSGR